jgi:hypothetical protein
MSMSFIIVNRPLLSMKKPAGAVLATANHPVLLVQSNFIV